MNDMKLDIIKEKIRKNINMDILEIKEVFDEESGKFTDNFETSGAYIKGIEAGRLRTYMEIGVKLVDIFKEIENQTGMTFEELRLLKDYIKE